MKTIFVLLALVAISFALVVPLIDNNVEQKFRQFEKKYHKHYPNSQVRSAKLAIFASNLKLVDEMNKVEGNDVFGVTKFSDLTPKEFRAKYLGWGKTEQPIPKAAEEKVKPVATTLPNYWSWDTNKTGIISAVKNQEQCGSCWAFSATETIESAFALAGNTLPDLAPQQIVDCDKTDDGCGGGFPWTAYQYVISAGGQEPESDYPYTAKDGSCKFNKADIVATIANWTWVSKSASTENTAMLSYVYQSGPVSIGVDASSWQFYNGGVLSKNCGDQIDHAVQATGFANVMVAGTAVPAWRVRNSWGADWGIDGYIWVKRGINLCAIATKVTVAHSAAPNATRLL